MVVDNVLIHKFRAPVYRNIIWVVVSDNIEKSFDVVEDLVHFRIVKDKDRKLIDAYTYAYSDSSVFGRLFIFFHYKVHLGRMIHEIKHAVNLIFQYSGVRLSLTNDEHECYYLETITDKVLGVIKKYKEKKYDVLGKHTTRRIHLKRDRQGVRKRTK
jgi:hypothetical protein